MVLTPARFPFDDDGGILALLRGRRAESDTAMARSLMTASLSLLTLVVVMLLAQAVFRSDFRVIPIPPPYNPPPRDPRIFIPIPEGYVLPPVLPSDAFLVLPSDVDTPDSKEPLVEPSNGGGTDMAGTHAAGPVSLGTQPDGPAQDPKPGDYTFHDQEPVVVTRVAPEYPPIAREAEMEGTVLVRLLIGIDGRVKRAEIESSSLMFDNAALAATRQWTFTPALANEHPVAVWIRQPIRFQLH
jgi:protein TonB